MRTIIAGSRGITNDLLVYDMLYSCPWEITTVLCGMAPGVDSVGRQWAVDNDIPVEEYPADWKRHGKAAGAIRNREMAMMADAAIIIWDGASPGTRNMLENAEKENLLTAILSPMGKFLIKGKTAYENPRD